MPFNPVLGDIFSFGITMYEIITLDDISLMNQDKELLEYNINNKLLNSENGDNSILEIVA